MPELGDYTVYLVEHPIGITGLSRAGQRCRFFCGSGRAYAVLRGKFAPDLLRIKLRGALRNAVLRLKLCGYRIRVKIVFLLYGSGIYAIVYGGGEHLVERP